MLGHFKNKRFFISWIKYNISINWHTLLIKQQRNTRIKTNKSNINIHTDLLILIVFNSKMKNKQKGFKCERESVC